MKKTLIAFGLCAGLAAGAAELNWKNEKTWKKTENEEFTIDYSNKGWPRLISKQPVKAGKFYLVTFDCKRDGESIPTLLLHANDGNGKNFGSSSYTFNTWTTQCAYFPAAQTGTMSVIWGFSPRAASKLTVKNGNFEEVTPEMKKQNLILNGDFEDETVKGTAFWKSANWKENTLPGKIVVGAGFLSGEKSLEMPFGSGIKSISLPMEKGKKYLLTFWAKGTKDTILNAALSLWSMRGHQGKHFRQARSFKLGNNWQEYKFEITVPSDETAYPDVKTGTGNISFFVQGNDGKYYLDDISYCEK